MKEMKKEKSCGAVIYKIDNNNRISFLIVKQKTGNYGFPKGHVEEGETEEETAIREIKEETNVDAKVDTNFRMVSTYSPARGVIKDVIYFIATPISDELVAQPEEIELVMWCDYYTARKTVNFRQNKIILKNAFHYIRRNVLGIKSCTWRKNKND